LTLKTGENETRRGLSADFALGGVTKHDRSGSSLTRGLEWLARDFKSLSDKFLRKLMKTIERETKSLVYNKVHCQHIGFNVGVATPITDNQITCRDLLL
jgi:hypothetical protein